MPHSGSVPPSGFQALILCGPGVSLNTFTSSPEEFPKALVPIANRPMVWYPLDWCYRMGITSMFKLSSAITLDLLFMLCIMLYFRVSSPNEHFTAFVSNHWTVKFRMFKISYINLLSEVVDGKFIWTFSRSLYLDLVLCSYNARF
jgi:hypothetical protein